MINSKRNLYIDVMKGLLIILVVIGHLPFFEYDSRTLTLIYSFHMPAFLIIGGILSHINDKSTYKKILCKRFKGILVPYFIFYLISFIIVPVATPEQKTQAIICMFNGIGNPNYAINLPLWFLTFYFVAITLFELIECTFYKLRILLFDKVKSDSIFFRIFVEFFTFIAIAILMFISFNYARVYKGARLPFNFEIATFCLGFVFFGKIISIFFNDFINFVKKNTAMTVFTAFVTIIFIAMFIVFWYFLSMRNGRIDLNARDYKDAFYMYFDAILGFIIFAYFSFIISLIPIVKSILAFIGERSIYILAYHVPSTIITYNIIIPLLPIAFGSMLFTNSLISVSFLTLCGVVISLFISCIHKACHFFT